MERLESDIEFSPRKILDTDLCDWCGEKKATITDETYVYCSKGCEEMFIENAFRAIEEASDII
jgi:hypothetical protein